MEDEQSGKNAQTTRSEKPTMAVQLGEWRGRVRKRLAHLKKGSPTVQFVYPRKGQQDWRSELYVQSRATYLLLGIFGSFLRGHT